MGSCGAGGDTSSTDIVPKLQLSSLPRLLMYKEKESVVSDLDAPRIRDAPSPREQSAQQGRVMGIMGPSSTDPGFPSGLCELWGQAGTGGASALGRSARRHVPGRRPAPTPATPLALPQKITPLSPAPRVRPAPRSLKLCAPGGADGGAPRLLCRALTAARAHSPQRSRAEGRTRAQSPRRVVGRTATRVSQLSAAGLRLARTPARLSLEDSEPPARPPGAAAPSLRRTRTRSRRPDPSRLAPIPSPSPFPGGGPPARARAHAGPGTRPPRWQGPGPSCQSPPPPRPFPAASGPDARPEKMSPRCPPQPSQTRSRRARGRLPR